MAAKFKILEEERKKERKRIKDEKKTHLKAKAVIVKRYRE